MKQTMAVVGCVTVFLLLISCIISHNLSVATAMIEDQSAVIIIDAGHGGEDGGAIGVSGIKESTINLGVAHRLEQILSFCGFPTEMIRTSDQSIYTEGDTISEKKISDLKNRVKTVNSFHRAILISIHQNHFSEEKYSGAQVFYADTDQSKQLAVITQNHLRRLLNPENKREAKQAQSVYLMKNISCTGILVECGFLSNRDEELLLQNQDYQTKIACTLTGALAQFIFEGAEGHEV